ncbi:hypothetical protein [Bradyrhizobium sp. Ai1a-2]|uniref:hypothetical protein n=1 Tax=Bradyrhizobium sp. Ai1a-2 TaxID=196490 RepID=UPI00042433BC|nr:hypothetical protein [Bradyrhizobium sp. Ai1a-2]
MNDETKASPEWEPEAVVKRLRQTTSPGQPSAVQVFLTDEVPASELPEKAKEIVTQARESLNLPPEAVKLGKVFRSAKSFSLSTEVPEVFDAIAKRGEVKSILESVQPDILPKPKNVKDVP